ncbi:HNH endonuclease [Methanococcoides seepicolus]|uniref:HNH endonuclease n=1 Tax=Methanococcoides seepicolus TaxID=2828780 RepID=A0A9E5DBL9_9EURY|nr:HNH endonuclease signature motif containing protein [Methanococcoides seepicolus]MCM1987012.1 HNH endonuclease [Methanococcoides seepicolus]
MQTNKQSKNIPQKIRDGVLLECDFSCCSCGKKYFNHIHHIKLQSKGGTHDPANLIVLCPNCHEYAHRGVYTPIQLKKMKKEYIQSIEQRLKNKSQLAKIQDLQISNYIFQNCIEQTYPREKYIELETNEIYFIARDLVEVGLVIDPSDMKPILVSDYNLIELCSLEVISNPFRFMLLEEMQKIEKRVLGLNYLVRLDVASSMSDVLESDYEDNKEIIEQHRDYLHSLIHLLP